MKPSICLIIDRLISFFLPQVTIFFFQKTHQFCQDVNDTLSSSYIASIFPSRIFICFFLHPLDVVLYLLLLICMFEPSITFSIIPSQHLNSLICIMFKYIKPQMLNKPKMSYYFKTNYKGQYNQNALSLGDYKILLLIDSNIHSYGI